MYGPSATATTSRYGKRKKIIAAFSVKELTARQIVALIETLV
jgi:hypothetical protein